MKLHSTVQDQAIVSNVAHVGEFRIRNSAKAFNILSSGLYANKIRAIIRELSCNAVDSHVAAGRADVPFEVHLPSTLEPWFSVKDFGTGLTHDQVTNIYTTYFESTKTSSNEFIGALGLGSKSPFSYTDNFTVTAVRDGRQGIYTAFINEEGVPSIALMSEQPTTDQPSGVEVRFAVPDSADFGRFAQEAGQVYAWFQIQPKVTGGQLRLREIKYDRRDIVPGVHLLKDLSTSYAVMGNIAYPVDVPNAATALDGLDKLLGMGLVMHFGIGELDFQASREGLSYIPATVDAIRARLHQVNNALTQVLAQDAQAIDNTWKRALFLADRYDRPVWRAAVIKYVTDTRFAHFDHRASSWDRVGRFRLRVRDVAEQYNINIRAFSYSVHAGSCSQLKPEIDYPDRKPGVEDADIAYWSIRISDTVHFVTNDTLTGASERAKYHWRKNRKGSSTVYVLEPKDRKQPMRTDAFMDLLCQPPADQRHLVSQLDAKPRQVSSSANVTIMQLEEDRRSWSARGEAVWREALGLPAQADPTSTYYYLPLSGLTSLGRAPDVKELYWLLKDSRVLPENTVIYGVRKSDIKWAQSQPNWINLDTAVEKALKDLNEAQLMGVVKQNIDWESLFCYNAQQHVTNPASPYLELYRKFSAVQIPERHERVFGSIRKLSSIYHAQDKTVGVEALLSKYQRQRDDVANRYPLLSLVEKRYNSRMGQKVAHYINLIDSTQGV